MGLDRGGIRDCRHGWPAGKRLPPTHPPSPARDRPTGGRNTGKALEWLETALRLRDPGLEQLKTDPLLDPLRHEPRFRAIETALRFPT